MKTGIPFEKWAVGQSFETLGRTISETDIVTYVNTVGYIESLFLDMTYLREKGHPQRMAPALLTVSLADALIIQTGSYRDYAVALLGVDGLAARAPVYEGDTIRVEVEVTKVQPSTTRPDRGVVTTHQKVINQEGAIVLEYDVKRMVLREKSPQAGD